WIYENCPAHANQSRTVYIRFYQLRKLGSEVAVVGQSRSPFGEMDASRYKWIHPSRIIPNDPNATIAHSSTPCASGRTPTRLNVSFESPVPIRNSVTVSPVFPSLFRMGYAACPIGRYVFARAARQNNPMNQGH